MGTTFTDRNNTMGARRIELKSKAKGGYVRLLERQVLITSLSGAKSMNN